MPHIMIEHSDTFSNASKLKSLAEELHGTMATQETIKIEALKTRTFSSTNVILGAGLKKEFLHITFLLLPGRSDELKQTFIKTISEVAKKYYNPMSCSFSVEVCELQTYFTER